MTKETKPAALTQLDIVPSEREVDAGVKMILKLTRGESGGLMLTACSDYVVVEGEIEIRTHAELDQFAKAVALAWKKRFWKKLVEVPSESI